MDKRSDAVLAGDFLAGIDVAFGERDFAGRSVFLRERLEGGRDGLAGATPGCVDCGRAGVSVFIISFYFFLYLLSLSLLRERGERHGGGGLFCSQSITTTVFFESVPESCEAELRTSILDMAAGGRPVRTDGGVLL